MPLREQSPILKKKFCDFLRRSKRLKKNIKGYQARQKDNQYSTFRVDIDDPLAPFYRFFPALDVRDLGGWIDQIRTLTDKIIEHRFDLLGSGWINVLHGANCRGFEGYRYEMGSSIQPDAEGQWLKNQLGSNNIEEAQKRWSLINKGYIPIDWQLDFKSGFRWSEKTWFRDIQTQNIRGADVKVPCELARMQHLPQLSLAFALSKSGAPSFKKSDVYKNEFCNQILDFMAANPPRFGVNWACAMEVAIRAANWLVGYDLFRAYGAKFDKEFEAVLAKGIWEHGDHIVRNLEWHSRFRNNHYLANIAGLLFVAAYLRPSRESDAWLHFAVQELINEVLFQFHGDGSNFEASTCYHRLSAEMVVYATALAVALPEERVAAIRGNDIQGLPLPHRLKMSSSVTSLPQTDQFIFPDWYWDRLGKMAEFTLDLMDENGEVPQIGDNDNGRFLKLFPSYRVIPFGEAESIYANLKNLNEKVQTDVYWMENHLDHRHLVAAIGGLIENPNLKKLCANAVIESQVTSRLASPNGLKAIKKMVDPESARRLQIRTNDIIMAGSLDRIVGLPLQKSYRIEAPLHIDLTEGLVTSGYPRFGLYIWKSKTMFLVLRCGPIGQNGIGGHDHNDQLSVHIRLCEKSVFVDPGSYCYLPIPEIRNQYRSAKAHSAPILGQFREPASLKKSLFSLGSDPHAKIMSFNKNGAVCSHSAFRSKVCRIIKIERTSITVLDYSKEKLRPIQFGNYSKYDEIKLPFSPGYGIRFKVPIY